jgi:Chaperone of endosialidase
VVLLRECIKVTHSGYGLDIKNGLTLDDWEHYVSGFNGTTFTQGDMMLYFNGGGTGPPIGAFDHTSGAYKSISDERMKTNIKPLSTMLDKINQLEPVTYNFKNSKNPLVSMGFIAQKVEKIFPSLVSHYTDTARGTDVNLMDYTGFSVIAIKAIQELQQVVSTKDAKIDAQQKEIDDIKLMMLQLQQSVAALQSCSPCSPSAMQTNNQSSLVLNNTTALEQNIPNPFANTTVINYILPQKFSSAAIVITDNNGKTLKQINVSGAGKGSITVNAAILAAGAYHYSLIVDGKIAGIKQMISSK